MNPADSTGAVEASSKNTLKGILVEILLWYGSNV